MMNTQQIGKSLLGLVLCSGAAFAHGDGESRVAIEAELQGRVNAGSLSYVFEMVDTKLSKVVAEADLDVVHEKKLHMFVFDAALKEFHHIHPEFKGNKWIVPMELSVNGKYWVWAQGQLTADSEEFTTSANFELIGGTNANPLPTQLGDVRTNKDGESIVTMSNTKIRAGRMAMPLLNFSRSDGQKPLVTPWLGAPAHVAAVTMDGDTLIHVHPMDHGVPNQLMLHLAFPTAGDYRLWVQYMDHDVLRTVPLSVTVLP